MQTVVKRKPDGTLVALVVGQRPRTISQTELIRRGKVFRYVALHGVEKAAERFHMSKPNVYRIVNLYEYYLATH